MLLDLIFEQSLSFLKDGLTDMMDKEKKMADSLMKFSKQTSGDSVSDFDKICLQVYFDLKELETQIEKMGG